MSCHKAIVVITGWVHIVFMIVIYICNMQYTMLLQYIHNEYRNNNDILIDDTAFINILARLNESVTLETT